MGHRASVHIVTQLKAESPKPPNAVIPGATADLRVFYPKTEDGFQKAWEALNKSFMAARAQLKDNYAEFLKVRWTPPNP